MQDLTELTAAKIDELLKEIGQEIRFRKYVYGRKVSAGTMPPEQAETKINRMHTIKEILTLLKEERTGKQTALF